MGGYLKSDVLFEALKLSKGEGATLHRTKRRENRGTYRIETGIKRNVIHGLSKRAARHYLRVFPKMVMGADVREAWGLA